MSPWTDIPDFTVGQVLTASRMNEVRDNGNIGHVVCTSATRPGSPDTGTMIYETDTGKAYLWDGGAWAQVAVDGVDVSLSGNLYRPNRPMFYAHTPGSYTSGKMPASTVAINVGGYYNNATYQFTAPFDGYYQFIWHDIGEGTAGTTSRYYFWKNGVNTAGNGSFQVRIPSHNNYGDGTGIAVMNAVAGDYFHVQFVGGTSYGTPEYGVFAGWMF